MFTMFDVLKLFMPKLYFSISPMIIAAGIGAAGSIAGGLLSKSGGSGGISGDLLKYMPGAYEVSDEYKETQDYLKKFGINLLDGEVPDYYKPMGEFGGKEFEGMLSRGIADVTKATMGSQVTQGRGRGGSVPTAVAQAVTPYAAGLRYQDYTRALEGRKNLLGLGVQTTENVRTSAGNLDRSINTYNLGKFQALAGVYGQQAQLEAQSNAATAGMISSGISSSLGALGTYFGSQNTGTFAQSQMPKYSTPKVAASPSYINSNLMQVPGGTAMFS